MTERKVIYSVVIPVYNTTETLRQITQRIDCVFQNTIKAEYELIMVDDCSPNPSTWLILQELKKKNGKMKIVQLARNCGQHPATLCGMKISEGDFVITMDDDLQHRPEDIVNLLLQKQHDIVIGIFAEKKHNMFKRVTSNLKGWFDYKLIGKPRDLKLSSFRLMQRSVVGNILKIRTVYPIIAALIFAVTSDVVNTEVAHEKRKEGKSGYSLIKMIKLFNNLVINNSSIMLRIIGQMGILTSLISICLAVYVTLLKIFNNQSIIGWSSIMVAILFFGGLILFSLGVIGEYLIRLIYNTDHRPSYYIRRIEQ
jgi:glycosyltransferase involved in cell wall biosynthesis